MKVLILLLVSNLLWAFEMGHLFGSSESCEVEDYADARFQNQIKKEVDNGGLLGPVRDQDSVGWCYAHAAADLTEHWLKQKGLMPMDQNISATAIALQYDHDESESYEAQYLRRELGESGDLDRWIGERRSEIEQRIDVATRNGVGSFAEDALQQELSYLDRIENAPDENSVEFPYGGYTSDAITSTLGNLCFESEVSSRDYFFVEGIEGSENIMQVMQSIYADRHQQDFVSCESCFTQYAHNVASIFPGIGSLEDVMDVVKELHSFEYPIDEYLAQACHNFDSIELPVPRIIDSGDSKDRPLSRRDSRDLFRTIDRGLSSGKIVNISYHSQLLYEYGFPEAGEEYDEGYHASVITGSMEICGEKYYKLRNSWGDTSCQYWRSNPKPPEIAKRGGVEDFHGKMPYFCDEEGNFIIKKDQLEKGLYFASYISN